MKDIASGRDCGLSRVLERPSGRTSACSRASSLGLSTDYTLGNSNYRYIPYHTGLMAQKGSRTTPSSGGRSATPDADPFLHVWAHDIAPESRGAWARRVAEHIDEIETDRTGAMRPHAHADKNVLN